jgi:hypothetical protein
MISNCQHEVTCNTDVTLSGTPLQEPIFMSILLVDIDFFLVSCSAIKRFISNICNLESFT